MIPIFDSLTHPTLTGKWLHSEVDASFSGLESQLRSANFLGACAVGLWGVEGYDHKLFFEESNQVDLLVPIASCTGPIQGSSVEDEIKNIKAIGYKGIKLHPRFCDVDLEEDFDYASAVLLEAGRQNMVVFVCTYYASELQNFPSSDPYWTLVRLLKKAPDTKVILTHGGVHRILQYADLARFNPNILLDLSYSIIKYKGSSVEQDIKYLFNTFDRKLCLGSDHPEYTMSELRHGLLELESGVPLEKLEHIYYKNILSFLNE